MSNSYGLDLSGVSKELTLLLEIIGMENDSRLKLADNERYQGIDWELFLQLAKHHRVYPILYSKVKNIEGIPSYVIQVLNREYKQNTFQMLTLSGEMERVSKLFIDNQIPLLFLKGPVIAADIYGDISLRTSKDLDILVSDAYLEKVEKFLLCLGYEKESDSSGLNSSSRSSHHITYFHPQKHTVLEIHWRLEPPLWKELTFDELWARRRISPLTSSPVYYLGEEDLFVYLVSHGARHGWFRLRWLLDIDQMMRKGFDLEKTKTLLHQYQRSYVCGQALILASELFETSIEGALQELTERNDAKRLAKYAIEFITRADLLGEAITPRYYHLYFVLLRKSYLQKVSYIFSLFYPRDEDTETLPLPKTLHFLYFPLRPFLAAARKIRKLSPKQGDL